MEFVGVDDFANHVYKCLETEILYKDITLGSDNPVLYTCGNEFDGEPGFPINDEWEIHFRTKAEKENPADSFNYQLLDRLRLDCEYYLGNGQRSVKHLWADTEKEQIEKMKELYNSFSDDKKPKFLSYEQILTYEELMVIHA